MRANWFSFLAVAASDDEVATIFSQLFPFHVALVLWVMRLYATIFNGSRSFHFARDKLTPLSRWIDQLRDNNFTCFPYLAEIRFCVCFSVFMMRFSYLLILSILNF